jgi:leucyl/phenylalanyl-tRNA---protein transferase
MTTAKRTGFLPVYLPEGTGLYFPDPRNERGFDGLVAIGGDLSAARLLHAYRSGIFPWYSDGMEILWWCPDPRAVIEPTEIHRSRSLLRQLRRGDFEFSVDRAFGAVLTGCADRAEGTWLLPEMIDAYQELHRLGHAHSFEAWQGSELVGGLYGVHLGGVFAAESMFHRVTGASKAVLVVAVTSLGRMGVDLFDVQFETAHLASMGAKEISRIEYLQRLQAAARRQVRLDGMSLSWDAAAPAN